MQMNGETQVVLRDLRWNVSELPRYGYIWLIVPTALLFATMRQTTLAWRTWAVGTALLLSTLWVAKMVLRCRVVVRPTTVMVHNPYRTYKVATGPEGAVLEVATVLLLGGNVLSIRDPRRQRPVPLIAVSPRLADAAMRALTGRSDSGVPRG